MSNENLCKNHFLCELSERFPRLKEIDFTFDNRDVYSIESTPAGNVEALYFYNRQDFENAVTALAYKLEKREIPASMGAMFLSGLVDHIAMKKCSIVILSRGGYSAIPASKLNISDEEWNDLSLCIRKNHELAHYVQRKMFPENKRALKDEIKADMVGLISAYGEYKPSMARLFLGTEGPEYRDGGRLQNYIKEDDNIDELYNSANEYIEKISGLCDARSDAFQCLIDIETNEKNH